MAQGELLVKDMAEVFFAEGEIVREETLEMTISFPKKALTLRFPHRVGMIEKLKDLKTLNEFLLKLNLARPDKTHDIPCYLESTANRDVLPMSK